MLMIKSQMDRFPPCAAGGKDETPPPSPTLAAASVDMSLPQELRDELASLQRDHANLTEAHEKLESEAEAMRKKEKSSKAEVEELKNAASESADFAREVEADSESQISQLESQLEDKDATIKRLTNQVSEASKSSEDNRAILDELDLLREKLSGAGKDQAKLAKVTKRLEQMEQISEEKKQMEAELNRVLKEKTELEAQAGRATDLKGEAKDLNQQVIHTILTRI